jgi:hypothetical protein
MVEGRVDAPGTYSITGTAKGVAFTAWHAVYSKDAVVPGIGKYTLLLKTSGAGAGLPRGSGYATMALGAKGGAALAGKLPDGENFSVTVPLVGGTAGNQLLIDDSLGYPFASPSAAKGSLLGALKEATTGTSNFSGTLAWTKPAQTKGDYPAEIDTNLNVIGSPYIPPTKGGSVLPGFTTGTLELSDTSGFVLSGSSQLTAANKLIINNPPDDLKVTVTPSSGVLKGSFLYPVPGKLPKLTNFSGVLFQDQIIGGGLFIGPDGSGSVSLTSP